jgi:hypothetical protein
MNNEINGLIVKANKDEKLFCLDWGTKIFVIDVAKWTIRYFLLQIFLKDYSNLEIAELQKNYHVIFGNL